MTSSPPADPISFVFLQAVPRENCGARCPQNEKNAFFGDYSKRSEGSRENPRDGGEQKAPGSSGCREYLQLVVEESRITGSWLLLLVKEHPEPMDICAIQVKSCWGRKKSIISADEWEKLQAVAGGWCWDIPAPG